MVLGVFNEKCELCHGAGYILEYKDAYYYYGRDLINLANREKDKVRQRELIEKAERLHEIPMQPLAVPCPRCNGEERVVEQRVERARLPQVMQDAKLKDFDWHIYKDSNGREIDTAMKERIVLSFVSQFETWRKRGEGLYICSQMRGSGKTFLASGICNDLMREKNVSTLFVSASSLIEIDSGAVENMTMRKLMDAEVLVLDDLGQKNSGQAWIEDILYKLIDERMQTNKVTIVTSNYRVAELEYDTRITDRLNKIMTEVVLPEVSVRTIKANEEKRGLYKEVGLMFE